MRIGLVHEEFPLETNFGGISTYQANLALGLKKFGHSVIVITSSRQQKISEKIWNGIRVIQIPKSRSDDRLNDEIRFQKRVNELLLSLQEQLDIVEVPEWSANAVDFVMSSTRNIPIITKLHTPLFVWETFNKTVFDKNFSVVMKKLEKTQIMNSDAVFSCTQNLLSIVENEYKQNLDGTVIPNPLVSSKFGRHYVRNDVRRIAFIGSLEERKGVFQFADAINNLPKSIINQVEFVFLGKDTNRNGQNMSTRNMLESRIRSEINVKFLGQVEHDEVLDQMSKSIDILVAPSTYDNLPYVILESMMIGIPVISSNRGGIPEIITTGESGMLIDPDNITEFVQGLTQLMNLNIRKILSAGGYEKAKDYNTDRIISQQLVQYIKVINNFKLKKGISV